MIIFLRIKPQSDAELFHQTLHIEKALDAFIKDGKKYNILGKTKQEIIEMYGM
jgi:hypothetical protein